MREGAWRLVVSPPAGGAEAMATDEALLEACAAAPELFEPVLRLYAFEPACLSLGRFQRSADVDLDACRRRGVEVVRRPSGGRAVLHDRDLTYAVVAPAGAAPFVGGVRESARRIGLALAAGLARLGVEAGIAGRPERGVLPADCFALAGFGELVAAGGKLAGSAQVRRAGAALQHGTVRLRSDAGLAAPLLRGSRPARGETRTAALDELLGRAVSFAEAGEAVAAGFGGALGARLRPGDLTAAETMRAAALAACRYRSDAWTWAR